MIDLAEVEKDFRGFYLAVNTVGIVAAGRRLAALTKGSNTLSASQVIAWGLVTKHFAPKVTASVAWGNAQEDLSKWLSN